MNSHWTNADKLIAILGICSSFALLFSSIGIPYITSYQQYRCWSCPVMFVGVNWYFVSNFVVDFLLWLSVGIVAIFLILLSLGKVSLFESVSEVPITTQN